MATAQTQVLRDVNDAFLRVLLGVQTFLAASLTGRFLFVTEILGKDGWMMDGT